VEAPKTAHIKVSPLVAACLSQDFETLFIDDKLNVMSHKMEVDHANDREMKSLMMRNVCYEPFWRLLGAKQGINMDRAAPTPFTQEEYNRANNFYEYGSGSSKEKEMVVEDEEDEEWY
jgi:hypothetical protein